MSAQVQEQMSFLQPVNETEVRKAVVKELKEYKALRVAVQNKQELKEKGIGQLFPRLQQTETINELKAKQIERALQYSLDEIERRIVEEKYLSTSRVKDITVYIELNLTKDQYYERKKDAIAQIARALGMI
ncbi:ArpU family phage packaging/lysis transcriptional regulator [Brevibacillus nitrificans]|uniref:ArpU family phage packaging/lysis transcriptional regulator n=1 Tax=Brevibacillus nitrificans TaxID=651560 RepID=UPI0026053571|nr:ArpU family phage packaging/lysis transcriptional regulator [Brevibacillus nitrificans]